MDDSKNIETSIYKEAEYKEKTGKAENDKWGNVFFRSRLSG